VLAEDQQLNGLVALDVPPGTYRMRLVVSQPEVDAGTVIVRDTVVVPAFDTGVVLSDVLVGRRGEGPLWVRASDTIPVSAAVAYPAGSSIELYFEVHGLEAGERYQTAIEVRRTGGRGVLGLFGGRRAPISLAFDGTGEGAVTRVRHTANLGSLAAGRYVLRVSVRARGDVHHTRDVSLTVLGRR
jgi:hypothetical protein